MKILSGILILAVIVVLTVTVSLKQSYRKAAYEVCALIDEHYYLRDMEEAARFLNTCWRYAEKARFTLSKSETISRLNRMLSSLRVSHLNIYDPDENRQIWENQGRDTGLRARLIDGDLVVFKVIAKSAADLAGIKIGDVILSINGELASSVQAQVEAGTYQLKRYSENRVWRVALHPSVIAEDMRVHLKSLGGGRGLLTIPSFLSPYFENPAWKNIAAQLGRFDSLIIDVRGNVGGSFPAMLRALSPFRCRDPYVGRLFKSQIASGTGTHEILDTLDAESQVRQVSESREVVLKSFQDYGCFDGPVVLLIDADSSSVTEIFAHAFLTRPRAEVMGHSTAGQVVMARWFSIPTLGSDEYQISIPIAGYETTQGHRLEENGVHPRRYLFYDLSLARQGQDSWLKAAEAVLNAL